MFRMILRKSIACLITASLVFSASAASATQFLSPVMDRQFSKNEAKSLDNLPDQARARSDELIVGVPDLEGEFNPFFCETAGDSSAATLLFDELLFTNNDGKTGAGVASYGIQSDGRTVVFTLNEGVAYADGAPVTSDDFINALYLLLNPDYAGAYDITGAGIAGVEAYRGGEAETISGIARVSDKAFSVTMNTASENKLIFFAIPALRVSLCGDMRRPADAADGDARAAFDARAVEAARAVSAADMAYGQYFLVTATPGVEAVFAKNPSYWRGTPKIGTLKLTVVPADPAKAYFMIQSGAVDIVNLIGSIDIVNAAFDTGYINLYSWEGDAVGYLAMDLDNALFADSNVRRALAFGFNREKARVDVFERFASVPRILVFDSFSMSGELNAELYPFDPERAKELLDNAGWAMGDDGLRHRGNDAFSFTLTYNSPNPFMDYAAPLMQQNYKQLGIDVKLEPVSLAELANAVDDSDYEMCFVARRLPADPALAANLFVGESYLNRIGFESDTAGRLLRMATAEADATRQGVLYEVLFQQLYDDLPFIPLYRRFEVLLINGRVMNANVTIAHDILADAYRFFLVDTLEGMW